MSRVPPRVVQANPDPLSEAKVLEFLCLFLPLCFVGGTASPIRLKVVV